jgi:5-methylcytosine-specific restriction protein A
VTRLATLKPKLQTLKPRLQGQPAGAKRVRGRAAMTATARIKLRDLYTCRDCGIVTTTLEVDHVIPLWAGGSDTDENKQSLCIECHKAKTAREATMRRSA